MNAPAHLRRAHNPRDFTPHPTPAVRCSGLLATQPRHFARTYLWQSFPNLRHDGTNINQAITRHHHREDPDAQPTKILLETDVAIDREQYVEASRGHPQQLAVLKARPTLFLNRPDLVVAKVGRRGTHSSRRTRSRKQRLLRLLESAHCLLAGHGGKICQELVEGVATFKIVEQRLERNSRSHEHGGTAQDFWVAVYDRRASAHGIPRF